jgi:putative ubiquitin-RnfH superfamily antitoxin RatB of RatAB toxin-antitoxin module
VAESRELIEVAYAEPDRQLILSVSAEPGMTARQAIERSGMLAHFPDIDLESSKVGVFGKATTLDAEVRAGDRIEIYRPLIADPKEARKRRAAKGKPAADQKKG